ncbi:helix-turn-helix domain-containing protein [Raineyella antarctica]|uniref:helix-turn-helix domain-containing protein n=1 Tax=Raineyella antarctica TaxID=1577474 RepID=UPI001FE232C8|nr:helix-turn-helix domain-containing protein [Raineyella antarctica]
MTFEDRAQIAVGIKQGLGDRQIGELIGRDRSVVWRERARNSWKTRGYKPVAADEKARRRRARTQVHAVDADPAWPAGSGPTRKRSRTPRQIAGRLRLEADDASVEAMKHSPEAGGRTVSHEAIYRWIYALPKGELAREGILLRSKRTAMKRRRPTGERTGGRIVGMVSIDDRPADATDRRVSQRMGG